MSKWRNWRNSAALVVGFTSIQLVAHTSANGVELSTPLLPGSSNGVPFGASAPPGIYFSEINLYWQSRLVDGKGRDTPVRLNFFETVPVFTVVPNVSVFGGNYYFYFLQAINTNNTNTFGKKDSQTGIYNTYFSPLNLSWQLSDSLFFGTGFSFFFPNGSFRTNKPSNGNAFMTFQPNFALSYLKDGWNLTANLQLNFNERNNITDYQSGNLYGVDFAATKSVGPWTFGVQGYYVKQYEPDKIGNFTVAATPYSARGNKNEQLALGPYVAYDFGNFTVAAWYDQNIRTRNGLAANIAWLKVSVPLGNPFASNRPITPSAIPETTQR